MLSVASPLDRPFCAPLVAAAEVGQHYSWHLFFLFVFLGGHSLKVEGICDCALSKGRIILSRTSPLIDSHSKSTHDFNFVLLGKSVEEQVVAKT